MIGCLFLRYSNWDFLRLNSYSRLKQQHQQQQHFMLPPDWAHHLLYFLAPQTLSLPCISSPCAGCPFLLHLPQPEHWKPCKHVLISYPSHGLPSGLSWWRTRLHMEETQQAWFWSLGREDPRDKERTAHSSVLAWKILWTEKPGGLVRPGVKVAHGWVFMHTHTPSAVIQ